MAPPAPNANIQTTDSTLLIEIDRAQQQLEADYTAAREAAARQAKADGKDFGPVDIAWVEMPRPTTGSNEPSPVESTLEAAFFGSAKIDPGRYSRDIGNVTREVIDRLAGAGTRREITIDIQAVKPERFDESEIRTISENACVLKFNPSSGFEKS